MVRRLEVSFILNFDLSFLQFSDCLQVKVLKQGQVQFFLCLGLALMLYFQIQLPFLQLFN